MVDRRFFAHSGPYSLEALSTIALGTLSCDSDESSMYDDVAPLSDAKETDISFLDNKKYISAFECSKAGACIVHPDLAEKAPKGMNLILSEEPYHAYTRVAAAFYPQSKDVTGIHPSAVVAPDSVIGNNVTICPGVVIGSKARIGENTVIRSNTVIQQGVQIGVNCDIGSNVTLQCCFVEDNVIIHTGVCIGQDGFGFAMGAGGHLKVPQLGRVIVQSDVEIGAGTTIDRGTGPDTLIGQGTKIDNLVQIGHNVKIGRSCVIVAQAGVSGSTEIGDFTVIGGQVGIAGHLKIGSGVQIAAKSGIMRDIQSGHTVGGVPAQPMKDWLRSVAVLKRLVKKKVR